MIASRVVADREIRKMCQDPDLFVTGEHGAWYVDRLSSNTLDRRTSGHPTFDRLVQYVRDSLDAGTEIAGRVYFR